MAVTVVDGLPGGGKSYNGAFRIKNDYKKYYKIYTNINGFKINTVSYKFGLMSWSVIETASLINRLSPYTVFLKHNVLSPANVKTLNWLHIRGIVAECRGIYDEQLSLLGEDLPDNEIDKPILEFLLSEGIVNRNPAYAVYLSKIRERDNLPFLKRFFLDMFKPISQPSEYLPTLLVIDEAQTFFGDKNTLLSWFLSYHRHLFFDIIFITQSYNLIHYTYHKMIESFLHAIPASRTLGGNVRFKYQKHISVPFNPFTIHGNVFLNHDKKVFALYKSGDKVRTSSIVGKYFLLLVFFILFGAYLLYQFFVYDLPDSLSFDSDRAVENVEIAPKTFIETKSSSIKKTSSADNFMYSKQSKYIKLTCVSRVCTNTTFNLSINLQDLKEIIKDTNSKHLRTEHINKDFANIYMIATPSFLELLGAKNEKNDKGFIRSIVSS